MEAIRAQQKLLRRLTIEQLRGVLQHVAPDVFDNLSPALAPDDARLAVRDAMERRDSWGDSTVFKAFRQRLPGEAAALAAAFPAVPDAGTYLAMAPFRKAAAHVPMPLFEQRWPGLYRDVVAAISGAMPAGEILGAWRRAGGPQESEEAAVRVISSWHLELAHARNPSNETLSGDRGLTLAPRFAEVLDGVVAPTHDAVVAALAERLRGTLDVENWFRAQVLALADSVDLPLPTAAVASPFQHTDDDVVGWRIHFAGSLAPLLAEVLYSNLRIHAKVVERMGPDIERWVDVVNEDVRTEIRQNESLASLNSQYRLLAWSVAGVGAVSVLQLLAVVYVLFFGWGLRERLETLDAREREDVARLEERLLGVAQSADLTRKSSDNLACWLEYRTCREDGGDGCDVTKCTGPGGP